MYEKLAELVSLTTKLGMKSTIYTFAYRTLDTLNEYRRIINLGLNKIIYSLADDLSCNSDNSQYSIEKFFDMLLKDTNTKLGFHYTISKDSYLSFKDVITKTYIAFNDKEYFDKISLLRFVPHGKGTKDMDLSKDELLEIKYFYLNFYNRDRIRLGSPWNIVGISNSPCIIADEIMIIGFDGIAYPCDSVKYFTKLGISGNIKENTLMEMYNSEYFSNLRELNTDNCCSGCEQYSICKSGCIGQKIIANYTESDNNYLTLKKCIKYSKAPKCMR